MHLSSMCVWPPRSSHMGLRSPSVCVPACDKTCIICTYMCLCTVCIHLFVTHHLVFAEYWCYLSYSYIVCSLTIWGTVSFSSFSIRKHHSLLIQQFYISNLYFNPKKLKLCFSCVFHFFCHIQFYGWPLALN